MWGLLSCLHLCHVKATFTTTSNSCSVSTALVWNTCFKSSFHLEWKLIHCHHHWSLKCKTSVLKFWLYYGIQLSTVYTKQVYPWMLVVGKPSWERYVAKKSAFRLVSTNTNVRSEPGKIRRRRDGGEGGGAGKRERERGKNGRREEWRKDHSLHTMQIIPLLTCIIEDLTELVSLIILTHL